MDKNLYQKIKKIIEEMKATLNLDNETNSNLERKEKENERLKKPEDV